MHDFVLCSMFSVFSSVSPSLSTLTICAISLESLMATFLVSDNDYPLTLSIQLYYKDGEVYIHAEVALFQHDLEEKGMGGCGG